MKHTLFCADGTGKYRMNFMLDGDYTCNYNSPEILKEIWIEDDEEPIQIIEWVRSTKYGQLLTLTPRSNVPGGQDLAAEIMKDYKRGKYPKQGVYEDMMLDTEGRRWLQVLSVIDDEPRKLLLNMKYWGFE
jgi:hypothetical protein